MPRPRTQLNPMMVAPLAGAWIEIISASSVAISLIVAPLAGAWIEIPPLPLFAKTPTVAPLAGAWIEITSRPFTFFFSVSLPLRERGLKSGPPCLPPARRYVAPLAGAWIEIDLNQHRVHVIPVAPLAGAWIEMLYIVYSIGKGSKSLPLRERGLKYCLPCPTGT